MKLWIIYQSRNTSSSAYSAAVVSADDEETARNTHPDGCLNTWMREHTWCISPDQVTVAYIGESDVIVDEGVVLAALNSPYL